MKYGPETATYCIEIRFLKEQEKYLIRNRNLDVLVDHSACDFVTILQSDLLFFLV